MDPYCGLDGSGLGERRHTRVPVLVVDRLIWPAVGEFGDEVSLSIILSLASIFNATWVVSSGFSGCIGYQMKFDCLPPQPCRDHSCIRGGALDLGF